MAVRVYADAEKYAQLAEEPFDGGEGKLGKRLRSASIELDNLTRFARFDVDAEGKPTDAHLIEVFAEATCAIVEYWTEIDDPLGVDDATGAVKIGTVSIGTTSTNQQEQTERARLVRRLGSKAVTLLQSEGLLSASVSHN